ncbi:MAG: DUF2798 domain-containing protein, partial [Oceanospirillaceae bacterium]|nr:DUF2798 domain-containing protein [Oceanospirillaceae bacterium]
GLHGNFFVRWAVSFSIAWPVAFPTAYFVSPIVHKLVGIFTKK